MVTPATRGMAFSAQAMSANTRRSGSICLIRPVSLMWDFSCFLMISTASGWEGRCFPHGGSIAAVV